MLKILWNGIKSNCSHDTTETLTFAVLPTSARFCAAPAPVYCRTNNREPFPIYPKAGGTSCTLQTRTQLSRSILLSSIEKLGTVLPPTVLLTSLLLQLVRRCSQLSVMYRASALHKPSARAAHMVYFLGSCEVFLAERNEREIVTGKSSIKKNQTSSFPKKHQAHSHSPTLSQSLHRKPAPGFGTHKKPSLGT